MNGTFQYDKIVEFAKSRCAQNNITLSQPIYIVDINLLNELDSDERQDIAIEETFFRAQPTLGKVLQWATLGNLLNPSDLPQWLLKLWMPVYMATNWDKLTTLIPDLHNCLTTEQPMSMLYLIHCYGGEDRTGEVSGAYAM